MSGISVCDSLLVFLFHEAQRLREVVLSLCRQDFILVLSLIVCGIF